MYVYWYLKLIMIDSKHMGSVFFWNNMHMPSSILQHQCIWYKRDQTHTQNNSGVGVTGPFFMNLYLHKEKIILLLVMYETM